MIDFCTRLRKKGELESPRMGRNSARSSLDNESETDTYPYNDIQEQQSIIEHEASVSKVSEEQVFYLMSRGLTEAQANAMIVAGFMEPVTKELPMEYAAELNALLTMSMEGSVG